MLLQIVVSVGFIIFDSTKSAVEKYITIQWRSLNEAEEAIPPRNKLVKIFTGALYHSLTVRKTSVTDDVTEGPLPNKILGCATVTILSIVLIPYAIPLTTSLDT